MKPNRNPGRTTKGSLSEMKNGGQAAVFSESLEGDMNVYAPL